MSFGWFGSTHSHDYQKPNQPKKNLRFGLVTTQTFSDFNDAV